jgi:hypothetical protein
LDPHNEFFSPVFVERTFFWEIYGQAVKSMVKNGSFWVESTVNGSEGVATLVYSYRLHILPFAQLMSEAPPTERGYD